MKRKIIILILAIALLVLIAAICWRITSLLNSTINDPVSESAQYQMPAPTPGNDLDMIEADADITIPTSATDIYAMISGFRELDVWVRFNLPSNDLQLFLDGTLCEEPLIPVKPERYTPYELDPEWWQPHLSTDLMECHGGSNFVRQSILIDRTDAQVFTIYVFSWTDNFATETPTP